MFGLLDSLPWDEGELGEEGKGRQTLFCFLAQSNGPV